MRVREKSAGGGIAVVTGATGGLGLAYANLLAGQGYDLIMTGRRIETLEARAAELSRKHGVACTGVHAELSTEAGIEELRGRLKQTEGIEVLVSNAGLGATGTFLDGPLARHLEMMWIHDMAAVSLVHAVLPGMLDRRRGFIVCLSSLASLVPRPGSELYTPTKAYLNSFIRCLDMSYRGMGIRFQALCPGFVHSDFHERLGIAREKQVDHGFHRWMECEEVVARSWRAFARDRLIVVPGALNRLVAGLYAVLPRRARYAIAK
jgi:short-subunit dehydrogenase